MTQNEQLGELNGRIAESISAAPPACLFDSDIDMTYLRRIANNYVATSPPDSLPLPTWGYVMCVCLIFCVYLLVCVSERLHVSIVIQGSILKKKTRVYC